MLELEILGSKLYLLSEKAIYIQDHQILLVADVHLGKSETFQNLGVPIPNQINQTTLDRLQTLCHQLKPKQLIILGDLFHSKYALVNEVLHLWQLFLSNISASVKLLVGNHDRYLIHELNSLPMQYVTHPVQVDSLILSHEPCKQQNYLNLCGHIHPRVRIKTKFDNLRLPCFYLNALRNSLILPSFGEFTGGFEIELEKGAIAYVIANDSIIPLTAKALKQ
jgi:DNA ligase-associated metallophosphoesterase